MVFPTRARPQSIMNGVHPRPHCIDVIASDYKCITLKRYHSGEGQYITETMRNYFVVVLPIS